MSKLLIDTSVLLDFMDPNRPESNAAVEVFRRCAKSIDTGYVCAGSLKDLYYVATKYLGQQAARDFTYAFLDIFEVYPLDKTLCKAAVLSDEPDFEDALMRISAEESKVDFILARDAASFATSRIKAITASEYMMIFAR